MTTAASSLSGSRTTPPATETLILRNLDSNGRAAVPVAALGEANRRASSSLPGRPATSWSPHQLTAALPGYNRSATRGDTLANPDSRVVVPYQRRETPAETGAAATGGTYVPVVRPGQDLSGSRALGYSHAKKLDVAAGLLAAELLNFGNKVITPWPWRATAPDAASHPGGQPDADTLLRRWRDPEVSKHEVKELFAKSATVHFEELFTRLAHYSDDKHPFPHMTLRVIAQALAVVSGGRADAALRAMRYLETSGLDISGSRSDDAVPPARHERAAQEQAHQLGQLLLRAGGAGRVALSAVLDQAGDRSHRSSLFAFLEAAGAFRVLPPGRVPRPDAAPASLLTRSSEFMLAGGDAHHHLALSAATVLWSAPEGGKVDAAKALSNQEILAYWATRQGFNVSNKGSPLNKAHEIAERALGSWFNGFGTASSDVTQWEALATATSPYGHLTQGTAGAHLPKVHEVDFEYDREIHTAAVLIRDHLQGVLGKPTLVSERLAAAAWDIGKLSYWLERVAEPMAADEPGRVRPEAVAFSKEAGAAILARAKQELEPLLASTAASERNNAAVHALAALPQLAHERSSSHHEKVFSLAWLKQTADHAELPDSVGKLPSIDVPIPNGAALARADQIRASILRAEHIASGNELKLHEMTIEGVGEFGRKFFLNTPRGQNCRAVVSWTGGFNNARANVTVKNLQLGSDKKVDVTIRVGPDLKAEYTGSSGVIFESTTQGMEVAFFTAAAQSGGLGIVASAALQAGHFSGGISGGVRGTLDHTATDALRFRTRRRLDERGNGFQVNGVDDYRREMVDNIWNVLIDHALAKRQDKAEAGNAIGKLARANWDSDTASMSLQEHSAVMTRAEESVSASLPTRGGSVSLGSVFEQQPLSVTNRSDHTGLMRRVIVQVSDPTHITPGSTYSLPQFVPPASALEKTPALAGSHAGSHQARDVGGANPGGAESGQVTEGPGGALLTAQPTSGAALSAQTVGTGDTVSYKFLIDPTGTDTENDYRDRDFATYAEYDTQELEANRDLWAGNMGQANLDAHKRETGSIQRPTTHYLPRWQATPNMSYLDGSRALVALIREQQAMFPGTADDLDLQIAREQRQLATVIRSNTMFLPFDHLILDDQSKKTEAGLNVAGVAANVAAQVSSSREIGYGGLGIGAMRRARPNDKLVPSLAKSLPTTPSPPVALPSTAGAKAAGQPPSGDMAARRAADDAAAEPAKAFPAGAPSGSGPAATHAHAAIPVSRSGEPLGATEWLTDGHMTAYIRELRGATAGTAAGRDVLILDPAIIQALRAGVPDQGQASTGSRTRDWLSSSDPDTGETTHPPFIVVPLSNAGLRQGADAGSHWTLLLVDRRNLENVRSFHFNSRSALAMPAEQVSALLGAKMIEVDTPQQANGYDCGPHVLATAQLFTAGLRQRNGAAPSPADTSLDEVPRLARDIRRALR
ncbi:MAG: Ulp1 family isopeptidase [Janthinobacterium lividum]